jgi:hypothetical protein
MSSALDQAAIAAAMQILDDHIAALNARDERRRSRRAISRITA